MRTKGNTFGSDHAAWLRYAHGGWLPISNGTCIGDTDATVTPARVPTRREGSEEQQTSWSGLRKHQGVCAETRLHSIHTRGYRGSRSPANSRWSDNPATMSRLQEMKRMQNG